MLELALIILRKDLRLVLRNSASFTQALLLGLLLIFLFSLSRETGQAFSPAESATIFWLSSLFCQVLIFNQLYIVEEENNAKICLLLSPSPIQGAWLGKTLAAFCLLLLGQCCFFAASIIFLAQTNVHASAWAVAGTLLCDFGLCALGSLLGAIGQGQSGRDALLSILLFPLLTPLLLAGINLTGLFYGLELENIRPWLAVAGAFDAIFTACGLLLFGFLYQDDE